MEIAGISKKKKERKKEMRIENQTKRKTGKEDEGMRERRC